MMIIVVIGAAGTPPAPISTLEETIAAHFTFSGNAWMSRRAVLEALPSLPNTRQTVMAIDRILVQLGATKERRQSSHGYRGIATKG